MAWRHAVVCFYLSMAASRSRVVPKWISAALALVALLAGGKSLLAEVTAVLPGTDFCLVGACWIWESGRWEHSKICPLNYSLNLLHTPCKVTQQTLHKDRKRPLCTHLLGAELGRRGHLQWPFPTWGSPIFSKFPIIQPHPLFSHQCLHFKDNSTQTCGLEGIYTALHPAISTGWLCRRLGFTTDLLSWGASLSWPPSLSTARCQTM